MKTIILVWKNHYTKNRCDDLFTCIKATCFLYHLSQTMKFHLFVDFQHNSISKCLTKTHPYKEYILEHKIPIIHDVEHFIKTSDSNFLFFYTPTHECVNPSKECKQFIRNLIAPPEIIQQSIQSIPVHNILHLQLNNPIIEYFNIIQNVFWIAFIYFFFFTLLKIKKTLF